MNQSWVQMSAVIGLGLFGHAAGGVPTAENPVELGRVIWHRELDVALEQARTRQKPVLLLFQEIPG